MFGIPTVVTDYTNDPEIFDPNNPKHFKLDPEESREKNLYRLHKAMITVYRNANMPNSVGKQIAARNAVQILDNLLNPPVVEEFKENDFPFGARLPEEAEEGNDG